MTSKVTQEIRKYVEGIQRRSVAALGESPEDFLGKIPHNLRLGLCDEELTPEKLAYARKAYEEFSLADFYCMFPEYHYDISFENFLYLLSCSVTPFDNPTFLQRFNNLIPLCHDFYTGEVKEDRKNIILTSLPFLDLNGICQNLDDRNCIVFLNQGLLSILPAIFDYLLPIINKELFENKNNSNHVDAIINIIMSSQFFSSSYQSMADQPGIQRPHAHEKWYFREFLRPGKSFSKADKYSDQSKFEGHPSNLPYSSKMGKYYALRGAFTFILAHEFSHAYNDHGSIRNVENINLRGDNFIDSFGVDFKAKLAEWGAIPTPNDNFNVNQPIEEEADAHGLFCVARYCEHNGLDEVRTTCAHIGAVATYVVMHIWDHLRLIYVLGSQEAKDFLKIDPHVRNIVFGAEHPTAITRLGMALRHGQFDDFYRKDDLNQMNNGLTKLCTKLSSNILNISESIEAHLRSKKALEIDISYVFGNGDALGASDLEGVHLKRIKEFVSQRKPKSNVVQLFGRREKTTLK